MPTDKDSLHTASNRYVCKYYELAVRCGLDAGAILRNAGIEPDVLALPDGRTDAEKLARFSTEVWDLLQDEGMKLSASPIPRGSFFLMGKLTVHEASLRRALALGTRFYGLVTRAFDVTLEESGCEATVSLTMTKPHQDKEHLLAEILLMGWHRYSCWLISENIPLNKVFFDYPAPLHLKEYIYLFPGEHVFSAPRLGFSFHRQYLERDVVHDAQTLVAFMRRCPYELFLQPKTDFTLTGELKALLHKRRSSRLPTIEEAAEATHITRRSLIRKLKEEGSSYQKIKDGFRRDRAIKCLVSSSMSVAEVAERVGYSDPAVFTRAFKSWTGLSPRQYRARVSLP